MKLIDVKNYLRSILSKSQVIPIGSYKNIAAFFYRNNLTALAVIYGSDKWGNHSYTTHYAAHFKKFRGKKTKLLEIGVGGNESKALGGASLKMWKNYFRKGDIYAIDIHDKSRLQEKRIKIFKGDQSDKVFLSKVGEESGPFDIIIDDGSHFNDHIITSFTTLFQFLNDGGIYVVEDLQTSYWESFGGSNKDLKKPDTAMNFFKTLADGINYSEYKVDNYQATYFDKHVISIHFYHNIVFIYKGEN